MCSGSFLCPIFIILQVYDECVQEAGAFDTPFTGLPPSQLLQNIAHACRRVYRTEWRHSVSHTRAKALSLARRDLEEEQARFAAVSLDVSGDVEMQATPRPDQSDNTVSGTYARSANARKRIDTSPFQPKRRKLHRNDSMDFLPFSRNLANVERCAVIYYIPACV